MIDLGRPYISASFLALLHTLPFTYDALSALPLCFPTWPALQDGILDTEAENRWVLCTCWQPALSHPEEEAGRCPVSSQIP